MQKSYQEAEDEYKKLVKKVKVWDKEKFDKSLEHARGAAGTNQAELEDKYNIDEAIHTNTRVSRTNNFLKQ